MAAGTISICARSADGEQHGRDAARQRSDARTNLFVVAALSSDEGSGPVRIRNMSAGGALIEGSVIAPEGGSVRLSRGSLSVAGQIAWRQEGRAGVRFDVAISVPEWLPAGIRAAEQQRVDAIVHCHKTGLDAAAAPLAAAEPACKGKAELAVELASVAAAITAAAEELATDKATITRHPDALQILDVTARHVEKLVDRLGTTDRGRCAS